VVSPQDSVKPEVKVNGAEASRLLNGDKVRMMAKERVERGEEKRREKR